MLVFDPEGQDGSCLIMSTNSTNVSLIASGITPAAGRLLHDFLLELEQEKETDSSPFSSSSLSSSPPHQRQLEITLSIPPISGHDPSLFALWIMAVGSLILASLWSATIELHKLQRGGRKREHGSNSGGGSSDDEDEVAIIDVKGAASFIVFASAGLMLMFFLSSKWLMMVLVVLFALATMQAMAWVMIAALHHFARHHHGSTATTSHSSMYTMTINLPSFLLGGGKAKILDLLCVCLAAGTSTTWIFIRNRPSAWILQDIMSIALIINILLILKIPNLKVATILLPLAFLYDIWWVFLQPAVTGGPSVMVAVATGGGAGESLPMLLKFPQLNALGTNRPMSLLGLGDVVLPGLLVAFTCKYDALKMTTMTAVRGERERSSRRGVGSSSTIMTKYRYFIPAIIGYGWGLLLTYVALTFSWFGDQGQPALLYLVPCTLGTVLCLGWMRGELKGLWEFDKEEKFILLLTNSGSRSRGGGEDEEQQGGYASYGSNDGDGGRSDGPDTALLSSPNSVV